MSDAPRMPHLVEEGTLARELGERFERAGHEAWGRRPARRLRRNRVALAFGGLFMLLAVLMGMGALARAAWRPRAV
jgi:hypothetical protein